MPRISFLDSLWILSSFVLTELSHVFFSNGPDFEGGIFYITFVMIYSLLVYFLSKKNLLTTNIHPFYFLIGCIILFAGYPLFENDHFRYLWEGKVFVTGNNPYLFAPDSKELSTFLFPGREYIGFKSLTSIYPPLGLLWFGLGGIFGLIGLMGLNSLLVYLVFKRLDEWKVKPLHLALVFPYFQKEFIQSIHVDLFAFIFIFFVVSALRPMSWPKAALLMAMSYWVKILGILALPAIFYKERKRNLKLWISLFIIALSLPIGLYFYLGDLGSLTGPLAFRQKWVWTPGFYSLLTRVFGLPGSEARIFGLIAFVIYGIYLGIYWGYKNKKTPNFSLKFLYLIFLGVMFFSPVYNAWYAIWFLGLALLLQNNFGVLYGVFSCWCYIAYGNPQMIPLGELMAHLFFPFCLWEVSFFSFKSVRITKQKMSKINLH